MSDDGHPKPAPPAILVTSPVPDLRHLEAMRVRVPVLIVAPDRPQPLKDELLLNIIATSMKLTEAMNAVTPARLPAATTAKPKPGPR